MDVERIDVDGGKYYWTWKDLAFLPYAWLEKKDLDSLPTPFVLTEIHPDCPIGFNTENKDEFTNIILLPDKFKNLNVESSLRKDIKRIENKNAEIKLVYDESDALDKSKNWFLELWEEDQSVFQRRLHIWKEKCYTISAYLNEELIAVHIAMKENDTILYFGCWWNRKHKPLSTPIFLLKKDIERSINDNVKYYDLGIGDQPYKKKWSVIEKPTKYYAIVTDELAEYLKLKNYVKME